MTLRRWIPLAALAVAAWMPADASAQDTPRVSIGREVDDATRAAADRVSGARAGAEDAVEGARRRVEQPVSRADSLTEREVLAKMARAEGVHVERLAKLDRLRALAQQSGDAERVRAVDELRSKEIARRQRQVRNARNLVGESNYDRYAQRLANAKAERRRRAADDKEVNPRRARRVREDMYGDDAVDPQRRGAAPERGATRDATPGRGSQMRDATPPRGRDANRAGGSAQGRASRSSGDTNRGRGNR